MCDQKFRDYDIFGYSKCGKNCKNPILGINNVDPKPELNVQNKIFFLSFIHFYGAVQK